MTVVPAKAPFSGPYYGSTDPKKRGPSSGPYILAMKRGLSRWDSANFSWQTFTPVYNKKLENAIVSFKAKHGIDSAPWVWGQTAHNALLKSLRKKGAYTPQELALDQVALNLMADAYDMKFPGVRDLALVRSWISNYLNQMVVYKDRWHYRQQRPMKSLGVAPATGGSDDCSSLCVTALYWARLNTKINVPDPTGYGYNGYGNSVTLFERNKARQISLGAKFEIGDFALFGPGASRHAIICMAAGNAANAVWASHGSEAGPYACTLNYRKGLYGGPFGDLFAVVRPTLIL